MSKKSKTKTKAKAKKAAKATKTAAHGKKTLKKTAKPKPKAATKGKTSMAGKKDDEERREARKAGEIDTGVSNEHPALRPDGTEYEEDPMAPPPDGPLSPSEAARVDQGGEVDLSGSPGSAGEHVPVIEPSREHDPGTTHENRPPREDSNPQETAARTRQAQYQDGLKEAKDKEARDRKDK